MVLCHILPVYGIYLKKLLINVRKWIKAPQCAIQVFKKSSRLSSRCNLWSRLLQLRHSLIEMYFSQWWEAGVGLVLLLDMIAAHYSNDTHIKSTTVVPH